MSRLGRRPLRLLFRRPASVVLRQRREGAGLDQAGAIRSCRACSRSDRRRARDGDATFFARLDRELRATVHEVKRLTPTIVELIVKAPGGGAPRSGRGSSTGCRISPALAPVAAGTRMQMEGLALTGAWVDRERGLVSTIVLEMGGSSNLCAMLAPGEPVVLMGPTGTSDAHRRGRDRDARRRRPRQRGAVLDRAGVARRGLAGALLRRLQEEHRPLQGRRHRGRRRCHRLVLRRGARVPAGTAAGLAPSSATSCRRWKPTRPAGWARRRSRCGRRAASSPSARTG